MLPYLEKKSFCRCDDIKGQDEISLDQLGGPSVPSVHQSGPSAREAQGDWRAQRTR